MSIKVAIVEDNAGVCEELQYVISKTEGLTCVVACRNMQNALRRIPPLQPDVIVMDIQLPDGTGIECTSRLKLLLPETQILMFTIQDDASFIVKALEAGASGYLLKGSETAAIAAAIKDIANHGAPMSREVARKLVDRFHKTPERMTIDERLTPREDEILSLLSRGLLYKEIADTLSIKLSTVGSHVKSIYRKLHVGSRTEAVVKYLG